MSEELIRAACEAANCKYPDMEAMANFKREVTPSVVIGLIDGLRHAKGMAAINDARANGAAETIQHLRDDIAELRAQLPSQGGEAVEVVASIAVDAEGGVRDFTLEPGLDRHPGGYTVTPLMTVAQHRRILAAATHPADQVAEGVVVPVQLLKIIEQSWRIPNGCPKSVSEEVGEIISNGLAELRALLASAEGGSE